MKKAASPIILLIGLMGIPLPFACSSSNASTTGEDAGGGAGGSGGGSAGGASDGGNSSGVLGDAEKLYLAGVDSLIEGLYTADCSALQKLQTNYENYSAAMTNEQYVTLATSRFKPVLDFMARKACNDFKIVGSFDNYKSDALNDSPALDFLSGTPLLQAIVKQSSDLDSLLATVNTERQAQGLDPIIIAEYINSVLNMGATDSTLIFIPGWPGRPKLHQWLQVQRTLGDLFFVTLEPREDGSYNSYIHPHRITTTDTTSTLERSFGSGNCLECHYTNKPLRMRATSDATEAAKLAGILEYLDQYPAKTNHPDYNPLPNSPGIGTGGNLTLEQASTYAGRTLTAADLDTLNKNTACDTCHNDTIAIALRPPLSRTPEILMENGFMPPGSGVVDKTARDEALKVMLAAYKVKLKSYLVGE